ncbi:MAG: hypothetical protein OXH16_22825 [Gemmatimonadetes bacterium]|nr:hypothetical protein [Gemmatimonadota bacterium]
MAYRRLFILVEGDDDERFFDRLIRPIYEHIYDYVQHWKYSQQKLEKVNGFLNSINSIPHADYIFVADMDESPCVTAKKERITSQFEKLSEDRILVVCREIESWYLAGLNDDSCSEIDIRTIKNTDRISKEQFNRMMPEKFVSRIDFMQEIMKLFDLETASTKNTSFEYFMRKYKEERDKRNKQPR